MNERGYEKKPGDEIVGMRGGGSKETGGMKEMGRGVIYLCELYPVC